MEASIQTQTPTMLEQIRQLEQLRRDYDAQRTSNYEILMKAKEQHVAGFQRESELARQVVALETFIKAEAAAAFNSDPTIGKKPFPGVGIRVSDIQTPRYDIPMALAWAKKHDMCLSLDTKAFEALCEQDSTRPDFVVIERDTRIVATIATDLTKALEGVQ